MTEGNHGGCCDINHRDIIVSWCDNLVEVLLFALVQSHANILYMDENVSTSKGMFWTAELRELKQKSVDIHRVWKMMGRPKFGKVSEERLCVKCHYKRAICESRRN